MNGPMKIDISRLSETDAVALSQLLGIEHDAFPGSPLDMDGLTTLLKKGEGSFHFASLPGEPKIVAGYSLTQYRELSTDIFRLGVRPACQRQGIGTSLVEFVKERALRMVCKYVQARTSELNLPAQMFLRKCGFECVGTDSGPVGPEYVFRFWFPNKKRSRK